MIVTFNSEEERLAHPQAKLLSKGLYDAYFRDSGIHSKMLALMTVDSDRLIKKMRRFSDNPTLNEYAFACIVSAHLDMDAGQLRYISMRMQISPEVALRYAVLAGHLPLYRYLLPLDESGSCLLTQLEIDTQFREAIGCGHFDLVAAIIELYPHETRGNLFFTHFFRIAKNGVDFLDRSIVLFLGRSALQSAPVSAVTDEQLTEILRHAAQVCDVALLQRLENWLPGGLEQTIKNNGCNSILWAARYRRWHFIRSIQALYPNLMFRLICSNDFLIVRDALQDHQYQMLYNFFMINADSFEYANQHKLFSAGRNYEFIRSFLQSLRDKNNITQLSAEHTMLCYYILRFLIRQLDERDLPEIKFLTDIPSLRKHLVQIAIEPVVSAEEHLYVLARELGYVEAAHMLMQIPILENCPGWQGRSLWKPVPIKAASIHDKPVQKRTRSNSI